MYVENIPRLATANQLFVELTHILRAFHILPRSARVGLNYTVHYSCQNKFS